MRSNWKWRIALLRLGRVHWASSQACAGALDPEIVVVDEQEGARREEDHTLQIGVEFGQVICAQHQRFFEDKDTFLKIATRCTACPISLLDWAMPMSPRWAYRARPNAPRFRGRIG